MYKYFVTGGSSFFMNTNEECLLLFLKNPGRIGKTTSELNNFIFSKNDNIINKEFAALKTGNPIKEKNAYLPKTATKIKEMRDGKIKKLLG